MEPHTVGQLGLMEETPCGLADDFVWSVTQDVNNAVRRVQNCGIVRKILEPLVSSTGSQQIRAVDGDEGDLHDCGQWNGNESIVGSSQ
jgi:hypothetical protein